MAYTIVGKRPGLRATKHTSASIAKRQRAFRPRGRRPQIHELTDVPSDNVFSTLSGSTRVKRIVAEPREEGTERTQRRKEWSQQIRSVAEAGRPHDVVDFTMPGFKLIQDRFVDRRSYTRDIAESTNQPAKLTTLPRSLRPSDPLLQDCEKLPTDVMELAYSRSMVHIRHWPMYDFDDLVRAIQNLPRQFQPCVIVSRMKFP